MARHSATISPSGDLDIFTEAEAAEKLRVCQRSLQRYRATGEGPVWSRVGRRKIIYTAAALVDWLNSRTGASA
jgi:hypothetical protein